MMSVLAALADLDHLVRFYQFGFVAVWPLVGLACVASWSMTSVAGLLAVAFFFNTYGVVLDDALHVDVDRTDPLRTESWVVRGSLSPRRALAIAWLQLPLMIGAHVAAGFAASALAWLFGAILGMYLYDVYGKRFAIPPLTEAAHATCAFLLVLYGATATGESLNAQVWPIAGVGAAFLLLVNAFHGGLRDIDHEMALGQRTIPIWLGCRGTSAGVVHISRALSVYAALWQATLIVLSFLAVAQLSPADRRTSLWIVVAAVTAVHTVLFLMLHRLRKPTWDLVLRAHILMLPLPVMLAVGPRLGLSCSVALFAIYLAPTLFVLCWWSGHAATITPIGSRATSFQTGV